MGGEDQADVPSSIERPGMVRKTSRKVPGGFGVDDEDDLSPTKLTFEGINTKTHATSGHRIASLDVAALPALPAYKSSFLSNTADEGAHNSDAQFDSLDEREMRRHLMDIESSVLPAPSPIGAGVNPGVDDTYLFDGPHQRVPSLSSSAPKPKLEQSINGAIEAETSNDDFALLPPHVSNDRHIPIIKHDESANPVDESTLNRVGDNTSSLETMSSSPTAAAVARTISRVMSAGSMQGYQTASEDRLNHSESNSEVDDDYEMTPRKPRMPIHLAGDSSDERSAIRYQASSGALNVLSADAGSTPATALLSRKSSGRRPKFLRSRHASQRSSTSSFVTNPESHGDSDITLGADYALQSGGAVPASGVPRASSYMLSRAISLGSMASGFEESIGFGDILSGDRALATLDEEERNRQRTTSERKGFNRTPPETPRAATSQALAPTDTVIAQHVRNVQVPESLAKEYRTKNGLASPGRFSGLTAPTPGRHGKNLTLKEQSSTIERLSKENFDLKLKVMFLSDRLDKLSEEGVKEMISENVELKTGLATMQRDNKSLRRKVKELEKKLKDEEGRPGTARSGNSSDERSSKWFDQEGAHEREEELFYLRERVEEYVTEIEKLKNESLHREAEKRKLAELVRALGERRGEDVEAREEMDLWKDLLEQESARREQSDEDNRKLRDEIFRLKAETPVNGGTHRISHTTNMYSLRNKRQSSPSRSRSVLSDRLDDRNGAFSAASTLVDELRKESEQLRHENAELRREVGAQTSMLTSRNREKERLYQEIEELKLQRRAGGSIAGDSIFERSASRAHVRSLSRGSVATKHTGIDEAERENFENRNAELRDRMNAMKLQNQELQRELDTCMEDFEVAVEAKKEAEGVARELQEELDGAEADLQTMQFERDEALKGQEALEIGFEDLRKEAQEEIDALEADADERGEELQRLQSELADRSENFLALQNEMRAMSEGLVRLEDDMDAKIRRIQELEQDLGDANREVQEIEKALVEANGKVDRLTVQQESSQGEIAFLREEQDADKIKIGDLEAALRNVETVIRDEKERAKDLEHTLANERHQREALAGKEKQEVQKYVNDLNREMSSAKDEARRLRKSLSSREVEATEWKERLMELENNLREALGDLNGTRSSLLKSIAKLQRELENTVRELDTAKTSIAERDRMIKQRDSLLEDHALEARKLVEYLDKERQSHRITKHQHETFLRTHQHTTRTASQQETRVLELEAERTQDRKKIAALENNFKDQMTERNNLLLALWNRLSTLCGTDWAHNNSLINGRALPSLEAVSTMLPGFSKNLIAAVKTIEIIVGSFKSRVRTLENNLWKEYQNLEHTLDQRTKKLDRLEGVVKTDGLSRRNSDGRDGRAEIQKLREMNRALKDQVVSLRNAEPRSRRLEPSFDPPSPSPAVPTGPSSRRMADERTATLTRHHSTSTVDTLERAAGSSGASLRPPTTSSGLGFGGHAFPSGGSGADEAGEQRWIFRLRELERRLKAEREARLLDRNGARRRLEEGERRNEELRKELERTRVREGGLEPEGLLGRLEGGDEGGGGGEGDSHAERVIEGGGEAQAEGEGKVDKNPEAIAGIGEWEVNGTGSEALASALDDKVAVHSFSD